MLAVSPLRTNRDDEIHGEDMDTLSIIGDDDFAELSEGNLLESINFDDLFAGINHADVLPDLEMDPDMFADFSLSAGDNSSSVVLNAHKPHHDDYDDGGGGSGDGCGKSASSESGSSSRGEEIVSKRDGSVVVNPSPNNKESDNNKGKKSSSSSCQSKNPHQTKKKVKKVDWTPELHRHLFKQWSSWELIKQSLQEF